MWVLGLEKRAKGRNPHKIKIHKVDRIRPIRSDALGMACLDREVCLRHLQIIGCQWVNVLALNEQSAAVRHVASTAAGLGGLLDSQPNFLAKRHLQGMAVGIADGSHIPDGRARVSRPVDEPSFTPSQREQPIHVLPTRACHA
jgi:hypothetical protein